MRFCARTATVGKTRWARSIAELHAEKKALHCKWVYMVKTNPDGSTERYKAHLMTKGYSQVKSVDYKETLFDVVSCQVGPEDSPH